MSEPDVSELLSVAQAIAIIDAAPAPPRVSEVPLLEADGLVLAEEIRADRDFPPFDKSMMDGFAVRAVDAARGPVELRVVGEVAAGSSSTRALRSGEAMAIMTGAPVPPGADCVIPIEDIQRVEDRIRIERAVPAGKAIARRGSDIHAGAVVLETGMRLGPAQIAAAASVGAAKVRVIAPPEVAILVTGNELVHIDQTPGASQIRNCNGPMLAALLPRLGCHVSDLGIAPDDPAEIREAIQEGLQADLLFICGGMSMGQYDYVPKILHEMGMTFGITKLRIKPGKPFIFATQTSWRWYVWDSDASDQPSPPSGVEKHKHVFGLPGNPVSAFVCTVRLAARLIARMRGQSPEPQWIEGKLAEPIGENGPREFYQPVIIEDAIVRPLRWKGSADVFTLARANALLVREENAPALDSGARVRVLPI